MGSGLSDGDNDITYTHGSTISADGIYMTAKNDGDNTSTVNVQEVECWDEAGSSGYGNKVNGVPSANIGKINTVPTANISKVNSV